MPAPLPEQKLHQALDVVQIRLRLGMLGRQHLGGEQRARAVGLLDADGDRHRAAGGGDVREEGAIGQHRGAEIGIEGRRDGRL